MKCPKCGYISFEHNQLCPKCSKDVTYEAKKLNLPTYRPNPPALLGALTGEADESYGGLLRSTYSGGQSEEPKIDVGLDDSSEISTDEVVFDDGTDLDISLGTGESESKKAETESANEGDEAVFSLDDLKLDDTGELRIRTNSKPSDET